MDSLQDAEMDIIIHNNIKSIGSHTVNDIKKCMVEFSDKKPFVKFETEYQLEQFREIEKQHFDEYNQHYSGGLVSRECANKMLALINQMETEIKRRLQFTNY